MGLSQKNLEEAIRLLENLLATQKGAGFWLVVCGGSALLAQEIISRSTEDVDDLRTLAPTSVEIEAAVRWILENIPVLAHRDKIPDLLTHLGHAHIIPKFQG